jgi:hypothetical protein
MYTGLGKLSIQSEKWRSGVVMFLNVKFCYEIQHFWVVASSSARQHIVAQRLIAVGIIDLPVDVEVVYTRLIQVPEPTSTLGLLSLGIIGAGATIKRQVKRNHSIEKETTKIG